MKKNQLSLLFIGIALSVSAQGLDLGSRATLRQYQTEKIPVHNNYLKALQSANIPTDHVTGLIKIANDASFETLENEGVNIINPGFDVTPNELIAGIITEKGILRPDYKNSIKEATK